MSGQLFLLHEMSFFFLIKIPPNPHHFRTKILKKKLFDAKDYFNIF